MRKFVPICRCWKPLLIFLILLHTCTTSRGLKQVDDPGDTNDVDDDEPDEDDYDPMATLGADNSTEASNKTRGMLSRIKDWITKSKGKKSTAFFRNPVTWFNERRLATSEIKVEVKAAIQNCMAKFDMAKVKDLFCNKVTKDKQVRDLVRQLKKAKKNREKIQKQLTSKSPEEYDIIREGAGFTKCVVEMTTERLNCTLAVEEYDVNRKIRMDLCGIRGWKYLVKETFSFTTALSMAEAVLKQVLCWSCGAYICLAIKTVGWVKKARIVLKHFTGHRCNAFVSE